MFNIQRNNQVIEHLNWISLLLELAEESSFKVRAYREAAAILKRQKIPLDEGTEVENLQVIKGIGLSVASTIVEFLRTGSSEALIKYQQQFSAGLLEILVSVRGLGVKKLLAISKQFEIEKLEDLLLICENGKLAALKGFGHGSVEKIRQNLIFVIENRGYLLYEQALNLAENLCEQLKNLFPEVRLALVGELRRKQERVKEIVLLSNLSMQNLCKFIDHKYIGQKINIHKASNHYRLTYPNGLVVDLYSCLNENWTKQKFLLTGSCEFLQNLNVQNNFDNLENLTSEQEIFSQLNLPYIVPEFREFHTLNYLQARANNLLTHNDIKGIIHAHTWFSDGQDSLEAMAFAAKSAGFEYIVISDHSQSSSLAKGMKIADIQRQHLEIERLNQLLTPFKIFKSVECDILLDGTLDYPDEVLAMFDLVIVAIHQQLDMPKTKATNRVLRAITNPYASILAHPTGRLLNTRAGYELDFIEIFKAAATHNLAIEINTSAMRLDLDWRKIPQALDNNCLLSINPDAHSVEGILGVYRGVDIAHKSGLRACENLSSYDLKKLEHWIKIQHSKRRV